MPPPSPSDAAAAVEVFPWRARWTCALVFLAVLIAYLPVFSAGFIWDDQPGHVTRPELRSLDGLRRIWFEQGATQQYYPLLHTAFWLEHKLWGDSPLGYHVMNLLLHATAACLLGRLLRQLAIPGAAIAAFLFALHPVAVESVAWVSEQKNTLSAVFYFLAASAYLRFDANRRGSAYAGATALYLCALLTKTVSATLPAALLVVLWWREGKLSWRRDWLPLLPWLALGALAGAVTATVERTLIGAQGADFALGPVERVLLAARVLWFYLGKLAWPSHLTFIYPKWQVDASAALQYLPLVGGAALLALLWRMRGRRRGPLAAILLFGGLLFPALGFVNVFPFLYSYVADHFQYLASAAILTLAAAGWTAWAGLELRIRKFVTTVALAGLAALTWRQSGVYRDVFTLYRDTLAKNPAAWMAHTNLAIALVDAGRAVEALPHYEQALRLRPGYAEGENNYGYALIALGRPADAVPHLRRAVELMPHYADAHNNLGRAFMALGQAEAGKAAFAAAIRADPRHAVAHVNLGQALAAGGDAAAALPHFEQAAGIAPNYSDAYLNWGTALTVLGRPAEGVAKLESAVRLAPAHPAAHLTYGRALTAVGRYDDALAAFRHALSLDSNYAQAHLMLAMVLQQTGRQSEAARHLAEARRLGAGPR